MAIFLSAASCTRTAAHVIGQSATHSATLATVLAEVTASFNDHAISGGGLSDVSTRMAGSTDSFLTLGAWNSFEVDSRCGVDDHDDDGGIDVPHAKEPVATSHAREFRNRSTSQITTLVPTKPNAPTTNATSQPAGSSCPWLPAQVRSFQ